MNVFSVILDTLQVNYGKASAFEIFRPFKWDGEVSQTNILIRLDKGNLLVGTDAIPLAEGGLYFIPAQTPAHICFGKSNKHAAMDLETFQQSNGHPSFLRPLSALEDVAAKENVFTILEFNTLLHRAIPFFALLRLPPFVLGTDERISNTLKHLLLDEEQDKIGKAKLLKNHSHEIVILLFRFMSAQKQFTPYIDKINYLLDSRLSRIILYIQDNLEKDLSNERLAEVALLSPEYISQFFRNLTRRNLQEYVEEQRMNKALDLVTLTSESMKEIAHRVGFKDSAYFSRRFKLKFESNARNKRKAEGVLKVMRA